MPDLPKKLKHDSIVEAVVEIQFEHSEVGEVLVGRLAADSAWAGYVSQRLPLADLPPTVRDQESNFRYQPIIQLVRPEPGEIVKVGHRVISLHSLSPYPGWTKYADRLGEMISALFRATKSLIIHRLGIRYINALTPLHGMNSIWDLNFELTASGARPPEDVVTGFKFTAPEGHSGQVNIASPGYVQGAAVPGAVAFVDIDIFSPASPGQLDDGAVKAWFQTAHEVEKRAFFSLWREEILTPLRED